MDASAQVNAELTQAAVKFIRRMLRFAQSTKGGFRMKVAPGGCSGFSVTFDLSDEPRPSEIVWTPSGLRIFLDRQSSLQLDGAIVDFTESRVYTGFVVISQTATGQCFSQAPMLVPIGSLARN